MATSLDRRLLKELAATPVDEPIPHEKLAPVLGTAPFSTLPGSLNMRDVGAFAPRYVKPGVVFRSGMLDFIPATSLALLSSQLHVSRVFDFRREDEIKQPIPELHGIELCSCPYKDGAEMLAPVVVADFAPRDDGSAGPGYNEMYEIILQGYKTGFKRVLEGLLSSDESEAVLFYCAGKSRSHHCRNRGALHNEQWLIDHCSRERPNRRYGCVDLGSNGGSCRSYCG